MRQQRILLVDDQPSVLNTTARMLERRGYSVATAPSAEVALLAFSDGLFDLVITDLEMLPGMNGLSFARKLKAIQPAIPVILHTTAGEMYPVVDSVLPKPSKIADILVAITQLLPR